MDSCLTISDLILALSVDWAKEAAANSAIAAADIKTRTPDLLVIAIVFLLGFSVEKFTTAHCVAETRPRVVELCGGRQAERSGSESTREADLHFFARLRELGGKLRVFMRRAPDRNFGDAAADETIKIIAIPGDGNVLVGAKYHYRHIDLGKISRQVPADPGGVEQDAACSARAFAERHHDRGAAE